MYVYIFILYNFITNYHGFISSINNILIINLICIIITKWRQPQSKPSDASK